MEQTKRTEWLEQRKKILTASDIAAVLNVHPQRTITDVYIDKTSDEISNFDMDHLRFGRDVEGAIANLFEHRTGMEVRDLGATHITRHPDIEWLGATLDRETLTVDQEWIPLELKHVGTFKRPIDWTEDPPIHYQIQCQIQAECRATNSAILAGLFPGYQLGWTRLEYDEDFVARMIEPAERFWFENVLERVPPEQPPHRLALDSIRRLYPKESRETIVLGDEALEMADRMARLRKGASNLTEESKQVEARLRASLGSAVFGSLNDGTFLSLKTTHRKGYTVEPTSFRVLRRTKKMK